MNKLFIAACKTLGVFQLYWALSSLVQVASTFNLMMIKTTDRVEVNFNPWFYLLLVSLNSILLFFFAFIMIFKTETIARIVGLGKKDEISHLPPQSILMKTGLILLGVFFLLSSTPNLVRSIADLYLRIRQGGLLTYLYDRPNADELVQTISIAGQIGLAIWIIVKPDAIIRFISRKKKNA